MLDTINAMNGGNLAIMLGVNMHVSIYQVCMIMKTLMDSIVFANLRKSPEDHKGYETTRNKDNHSSFFVEVMLKND